MLLFPIMSAFFFRTYPYNLIFSAPTNTPFLIFLTLSYLYYLLFFQRIPCITLTSLGTPSSGLVSQAWLSWTHYLRNNNRSSSPIPLPLSSYPKPVFYASFRNNLISSIETPAFGSPLFDRMANPLPLSKALCHAKTGAPSHPPSNLPSITHSCAPTPASFAPMPVTTYGVPAALHPHPLLLSPLFLSKPALITSWLFNMRTLVPPSPQNPPEHHFPILSSLVWADGGLPCGLVQGFDYQIQLNMSSSIAPPLHHHVVASLAFGPLTLTSLAPSKVLSLLATSNAPPTVSSALCLLDQTLLNW